MEPSLVPLRRPVRLAALGRQFCPDPLPQRDEPAVPDGDAAGDVDELAGDDDELHIRAQHAMVQVSLDNVEGPEDGDGRRLDVGDAHHGVHSSVANHHSSVAGSFGEVGGTRPTDALGPPGMDACRRGSGRASPVVDLLVVVCSDRIDDRVGC